MSLLDSADAAWAHTVNKRVVANHGWIVLVPGLGQPSRDTDRHGLRFGVHFSTRAGGDDGFVRSPGRSIHQCERAGKISGQAFVRRSSGKLLPAVGTDVFLIPRTDYADERISALYGNSKRLGTGARVPDRDPLYEQYMRKTIAVRVARSVLTV